MPAEVVDAFKVGDWVYYTPNASDLPDIQNRPYDIGRVKTVLPYKCNRTRDYRCMHRVLHGLGFLGRPTYKYYEVEFPYDEGMRFRRAGPWTGVILLMHRKDGTSSLTMLPNNILAQLPVYPPHQE